MSRLAARLMWVVVRVLWRLGRTWMLCLVLEWRGGLGLDLVLVRECMGLRLLRLSMLLRRPSLVSVCLGRLLASMSRVYLSLRLVKVSLVLLPPRLSGPRLCLVSESLLLRLVRL
ncbi:hypothetical protein BDV34DRAFT_188442 [Aspergillus parasiticus]|uniref:Uncharacterized protein n=1 Tax=Aspergillus parasiticus TaxID=5067 RepID=A0A5N6DWK8_ASPPA|nr:hypothetical protein BDV34DRAFT_188442 [Aspergillus parasiticus]